MKHAIPCIALATSFALSTLSAATVDIAFNAALTNETKWTYSDKVQISASGEEHIYFNTIGSFAKSPEFPFCITSAKLVLSCSSTTPTRSLSIVPSAGETQQAATVATKNVKEPQTFDFAASDGVRSFEIKLEGSGHTGNWHLHSAEISGVAPMASPDGLAAPLVGLTRISLRWENPDGAVSNRVQICLAEPGVDSEGQSLEYDFSSFRNDTGSARDATDEFTNSIPAFTGSSHIRLPANSCGTIQISKDDTKGYLVHSGFADFSRMSLVVSARIPTDTQSKTFGIGYVASGGATNEIAALALGTEFATNTVSLADVPPLSPIVFNTQGSNSKRVVHVDYLAFVDEGACVPPATNIVSSFFTTAPRAGASGLNPRTDYLVRVSAFDDEGNESEFSMPLEVRTDGSFPTQIRIQ